MQIPKSFRSLFDGMLIATLITNTFYAATYPYIHKELMTVVSDSLIALTQIIGCVSIVLFSSSWNKWSNKLFRFYPYLCVLEGLLNISICVFVLTTGQLVAYYLLDTIVFAIVTRNICCGGIKLKILRYQTEEAREHYTNNINSASAIATILGSVIAMILNLNFVWMLCIATFGNTIDNIFYIFIYYKTVKRYKENKAVEEEKKMALTLPVKVGELKDTLISHNARIALWEESADSHYSDRIWKGMFHQLPDEYATRNVKRIESAVAESLVESDVINILVEKEA